MWEKVSASAPQNVYVRYRLIVALTSIAKMQAKLGERTAQLEGAKALSLLKTTADDPANAMLRTIRAEAYTFLGDTYATLAESKKLPAGEAREYWHNARENYQRSLDIYLDLRSRGIATAEDGSDQVIVEIAKCDGALER
jgi:hypothetical protein